MTEFDEEALAAELKSLVGWGATPERLSQLSQLSALPRVATRLSETMDSRTVGRLILTELTDCLEELNGSYQLPGITKPIAAEAIRQAAKFLFCLTPATQAYAATQRRQRAIQTLSLRHVTPDTWRRPRGLELSFMRIVAQALVARSARQAIVLGYRVNHLEITASLTATGVIRRQEIMQEITSLTDDLSSLTNLWEYPTDPRPGVITVTPLFGCQLQQAIPSRERPGLVSARLSFPPLAEGSKHTLAYALDMHTEQPATPHVSYEPAVPVELLTIRLHFDIQRLPDVVWSFEAVSAIYVPGAPSAETLLQETAAGWYGKDFTSLELSRCYGLAWRFT